MGLAHDISKGPIKQCAGTCGYWSPEQINKDSYTTQPDWWSLGVTLLELLTGKKPFKKKMFSLQLTAEEWVIKKEN